MSKAGGEPASADAEKKYVVSAIQNTQTVRSFIFLEANEGVNV